MAVKTINNTAGLNGLVPTLLVFRAFSQMTKLDAPAPLIVQRATAIRKAMNEMVRLRAKMQVNNALNTWNSLNTKYLHDLLLNLDMLI